MKKVLAIGLALAAVSAPALAQNGHSARGNVAGQLGAALEADGTVVVYKAGRHLPAVAAALRAAGRTAVLGEHLGLPDERIGPLSDVEGPAPYLSTVLVPARRSGRGGKL